MEEGRENDSDCCFVDHGDLSIADDETILKAVRFD